ncbi:MAG: ATP-binding protein [Syntrophaceae bacterium]
MAAEKSRKSGRKKVLDCTQCENSEYWEQIKPFQDMVENSLTGICIIQDYRVVYLNPEQQRIAGSMPMLGKPLPFERVHPDDIERVREKYAMAWHEEIRNVDVDFRYMSWEKEGAPSQMKWIQSRGCIIQYHGREALLLNMIDITRARKLEQMISMEDKMASLGRMAAGLAHEIRNPLSGINIYLTMLKKLLDSGQGLHKVPDIITNIQEASLRIDAVIRRIMDFSKPSEPKFILCNINAPIEDAIRLAAVTLRKAGIVLTSNLAPGKGICRLDPQMIEQVLLNLITNAAEAMQGSGGDKHITISSSIEPGHVVVRVADSGPGIPPHLRGKIFDPFYTTKSDSTGIGLSLCHRIISDHKGYLRMDESTLGGADFIIELPRAHGRT